MEKAVAQKELSRQGLFAAEIAQIMKVRARGENPLAYVRTYGCQQNVADGEKIKGLLAEMGFSFTSEPEDADFILFNTCAVREHAEDRVFGNVGALKNLKRRHPSTIIAVCGCMTEQERVAQRLKQSFPFVNLVFGTHVIHRLPEMLRDVLVNSERVFLQGHEEEEIMEGIPVRRDGKTRAWVTAMYGCDNFCSYCIVPYVRGREKSRRPEEIYQEFRSLVEAGYKEITLLGQNVNSYGKDLHMEGGFARLLEETAKIGIERIRFTTSHPWDFTDEMIDVIARYENIMPFIHLPVQSGDSDILKIMGRRYTREQYLTLFHKIKERIPCCAISTDIIVGFPNETEEQFQNTLSLVDECRFDNAFTFIYSPREGTPAASMADNVALTVKQRRLQELNERWNLYAREKNEAYLGTVVKVLVDGASKKNPDVFSGYTETNKLVNFKRTTAQSGDIVSVKITACKTFSLDGEQI